MRVMILGGGGNQIHAIRRLIELGHEVVVSDYNESSKGKELTSFRALADTFSYEQTLEQAQKFQIDAILTVGTDQPILTVAKVANRLGLPANLSVKTAYEATNKEAMKKVFDQVVLPRASYAIAKREDWEKNNLLVFDKITYPAVVKPLDSQGQRGVFKVLSKKEAIKVCPKSLEHSRLDKVLIETYYKNDEVTVTGWAVDGKAYILAMTDRVSFADESMLGVCVSHEHPSVHTKKYGKEIIKLTQRVVDGFSIKNGPLYFQFFIGDKGIYVNEIACRIGGAYEDQFIPKLTGFDILGAQIRLALGEKVDTKCLANIDFLKNKMCVSVQLFFAKPGNIAYITDPDKIKKIDGIADYRCDVKVGQRLKPIKNASARAGFCLIYGKDEDQIQKSIDDFFNRLKIESDGGENLLISGERGHKKRR